MNRTLKTTAAISLALLALLSLLCILLLGSFRGGLNGTVEKQQQALVAGLAHELDDKLEEQVAHVSALTKRLPAEALSDSDRAQAFLDSLAGSPMTFAKGFFLFSARGTLVAEHPLTARARRGTSFAHRDYLRQALGTGRPTISGPYYSSIDSEPTVMVAVPILGADGAVRGVLGGAIGLWHDNFLGHLADTKIGTSGYLYLFNRDRTMVMHPDRSRIMKTDVRPGTNPLLDRALAGFDGSGVTRNSRGITVLASFKHLNSAPWVLAANFPVEEAYAPIRQTRYQMALGVLGVILCTAVGLLLIFRHMRAEVDRRAEAEDYAGMLLDAASDGLIGVTLDGRIRFVNRAALKLLGYQGAPTILGQQLERLIWPEDDSAPVLSACAGGAGAQRLEDQSFRRLDGTLLPVNLKCSPILHQGAIDGALITFRDISERRSTAQALRLQSAALQAAAHGIVITDREGYIISVNTAFCTLTGYTEAELVGQHTRILKSGEQDPQIYRELWQQILSGEPWHGEWLNQRRDGSTYTEEITITPVADETGCITHFIGIKQDINERSRTEGALKKSKEQLSLALEGSAIGLWDWHRESDRLFCNERLGEILGYGAGELADLGGATWRGMYHPEDLEAVEQAFARHFAGETPNVRVEARLKHRLGHYVWAVTRGKVGQRDDQGNPVRIAGTLLDISVRKEAEQRLTENNLTLEATNRQLVQAIERANQLAQQAGQASAAKSQFLANMSHEIRTPMHAILGACHLLSETRLAPRQEHYLHTVEVSAGSLLGLINDILDFSKIEAGMLSIERREFSVQELVHEQGELFQSRLDEKGLQFRRFVDPAIPPLLLGDPLRLGQILTNLLGNALKFTRHGQVSLEITLRGHAGSRVELEFAVRDTGLGIPATQQETLFQPFTQLDGSTTRTYGGTGLGLAICRQLTTLMEGEICCESVPGVGSSFIFRIPCSVALNAEGTPQLAERAVPPPRFNGERILLVEDNEIIQQIAVEVLAEAGLSVTCAAHGAAALVALREARFDLVLMDGQMPVMDGLTATRAIRENEPPEGPRIPIIAVTANAMQHDVQASLAAGADDCLAKPFVPVDLLRIISRWLYPDGVPAPAPRPPAEAHAAVQVACPWEPAAPGALQESHAPAADRWQEALNLELGIRQIGGNRELYFNLLRRFRNEYCGSAAALRGEIERGNLQGAALLAHSVKGIAGVLAALPLHGAATRLERALASGMQEAEPRIAHFQQELDRVLESLPRELDE
jgi:PAS domain S-box-containing protein